MGVALKTAWKYRGRKNMPAMKTMAWVKQTSREAMLERYLKMRRGMTGYLASFHSLRKKRPMVKSPNTMRQMTVAESQG